jgi:lipid II:glycine glycyltransferase (peptidoglycan interpeptide bridge formation enzyme)
MKEESSPSLEYKEINEFLDKHNAPFCQYPIYANIVENSYKNMHTNSIINNNEGKIQSVYPMMTLKNKLFKSKHINMPFSDIGGISGETSKVTIEKMVKTLQNKGKYKIEIRLDNQPKYKELDKILQSTGFKKTPNKSHIVIDLKKQTKESMWKQFHKHTRNDIRKAEKSNLKIVQVDNEIELKKTYKLYEKQMRDFGSPQHKYKYFKNLLLNANEHFYALNIYHEQSSKTKPIATSILLYANTNGYLAFNVSNPKHRDKRPNDLLYWTTIKWAMNNKNKITHIDTGQVDTDSEKGTHANGLSRFKQKWLGTIIDKYTYTYDSNQENENKNIKVEENSKSVLRGSKLKKFRGIWKKLPLIITRVIGPRICGELGL